MTDLETDLIIAKAEIEMLKAENAILRQRLDNECDSCACEIANERDSLRNELYLKRVMTNADKIRGISDEELAGWLVDATVCERVCDEDEYCHGNECVKRVTGWLRQPAEAEGKECDRFFISNSCDRCGGIL